MRYLLCLLALILAAPLASATPPVFVRQRVVVPFQPLVQVQAFAQPAFVQQHVVAAPIVQHVVAQPLFVQQAFAVQPVFAFSSFGGFGVRALGVHAGVGFQRGFVQRNVIRLR